MEKRYQVFVSSTFEDLREERQAVIQSLLAFDCIPVGMEFFPAADDTTWEVIKHVIAECDYYLVIVAGRYGSLSAGGISYTQKEYEYAVECGVPVLAFLHGDPGKIPYEKTEGSEEAKKKLEEFREICKQRLCKYWKTPDALAGIVLSSLNQLKKAHPAVGWVRADQVPDESVSKEILKLKKHIEELETEREELRTSAPVGAEDLAHGDDEIEIHFDIEGQSENPQEDSIENGSILLKWDKIFSSIGPSLLKPAPADIISHCLSEYIRRHHGEQIRADFGYEYISGVALLEDDWQTIAIQMKALGLIQIADSSQDDPFNLYWIITEYGETVLTRIKAIKRPITTEELKPKKLF